MTFLSVGHPGTSLLPAAHHAGTDVPQLRAQRDRRVRDHGGPALLDLRGDQDLAALVPEGGHDVIAKAQTLAAAIADYWTTRLPDLADLPAENATPDWVVG